MQANNSTSPMDRPAKYPLDKLHDESPVAPVETSDQPNIPPTDPKSDEKPESEADAPKPSFEAAPNGSVLQFTAAIIETVPGNTFRNIVPQQPIQVQITNFSPEGFQDAFMQCVRHLRVIQQQLNGIGE